MLAPTCTLAAPSIAEATPTGIDFAANGSGQAVSSNWNGFYYTNQDSGGRASGATSTRRTRRG